jgi:flagellar biosynthesis component FlhA
MPTITSPFERLYDELGELTNIARDSANVQLSQNGLTQQMLEELAANNTQAIKTARISFKIAVVAIVVSGILAAVAAKISWDAYKQDKKNYAEQDEAQKAMIDLLKRQAAAAEETAKIVERLRIQQEQLQQQRAKATPPTKQPGKSSPSSPPRSP